MCLQCVPPHTHKLLSHGAMTALPLPKAAPLETGETEGGGAIMAVLGPRGSPWSLPLSSRTKSFFFLRQLA
jgi:hypothetical protein